MGSDRLAVLRRLVREQPESRDELIVCLLISSALNWPDDDGAVEATPGVAAGSLDQALVEIERFLHRSTH